MAIRLRTIGGMSIVNFPRVSKLRENKYHSITPLSRVSGNCQLNQVKHDFHKRGFSLSMRLSEQQTRFIISSSVHPCSLEEKCVSLQRTDSSSLDRLAICDAMFFLQKKSNLEEIGGSKRKKYTYEINDNFGEKLFDAVHIYETSPPKFDFKLYGPNGSLLISHKLLQNLSSHLLSMQIIQPGGMYVGSIEETLDPDKPVTFELRDSRDEVQAVVLTDFANASYGFSRVIKILAPDKSTIIGKVSKKWGGFNDKLIVCIQPPAPTHMNVQFRSSLIGLCILLSQRYIR